MRTSKTLSVLTVGVLPALLMAACGSGTATTAESAGSETATTTTAAGDCEAAMGALVAGGGAGAVAGGDAAGGMPELPEGVDPSDLPEGVAPGDLPAAGDGSTTEGGVQGIVPQTEATGDVQAASYTDVAYADVSDTQVFDLYLPAGVEAAPLVVAIHGGGFMMGDKAMETSHVQALLDAGFAVATVNYRLSCESTYPAAVQDVKAAVRYLRANADTYDIDADEIAAWGESAGGYLADMLGATSGQETEFDDPSLGNADVSSDVQAVVSWYGITDFATMDEQFAVSTPATCTTVQEHDAADSPESVFLGGALPEITETTTSASVFTYLESSTALPPFSLAAGDSDCNVPNQQSSTLADAVNAAGGSATFTLLEGATHGDDLFNTELTDDEVAFLQEALAA